MIIIPPRMTPVILPKPPKITIHKDDHGNGKIKHTGKNGADISGVKGTCKSLKKLPPWQS
jgi:hypothetical protein